MNECGIALTVVSRYRRKRIYSVHIVTSVEFMIVTAREFVDGMRIQQHGIFDETRYKVAFKKRFLLFWK